MKIVTPDSEDQDLIGSLIFLAGPTPRDKEVESWRSDAINVLKNIGFDGTILVPERIDGKYDDYGYQIGWEQRRLALANCIAFWVPRNLTNMHGLTTNDEFGYWRAVAPKKLVFGAPKEAVRVSYQLYKAKQIGIPCFDTIEETMKGALNVLGAQKVE